MVRSIPVALILATILAATAPPAAAGRDDLAALSGLLASLRADGRPDSVETIAARRLPAARTDGDSALVQLLLLERGKTRVAYGRTAEGEPDLRDALARADDRGDGQAARQALRYLSEACQQLGRREEAAIHWDELRRRALAAADSFHAGKALYGLGRLRYRERDLAAADSLYAAALPFLTAVADTSGLAALNNALGNCRTARGAYHDAADRYARAASLARRAGSRTLEAMATNNLAGVAMVVGDPAAAVAGYRRARDVQRELGHWQQVGAPWRNLAQALTDLGHHDEAQAELTAALAFCRERGFRDEQAHTLVRLAELDLARGEPAAALAACDAVRSLGGEVVPAARFDAHMRAAEALQALGRGEQALAATGEAAALLAGKDDLTLASLLALGRSRLLQDHGRHREAIATLRPALARSAAAGVARYRLPLLVGAAASWSALAAADSLRACLDVAERLWEQERALPTDPRWRERRGAEAQQLFALRVEQALREGDAASAFDAVQRYKARTLHERILGPGGSLPPAAAVPPPVTLAGLQREVLAAGEALLDIVAGPEAGWLFLVTRDTCLVRPLPDAPTRREALDPLLARVVHPFGALDARETSAALDALVGPSDPGESVRSLVDRAATVFISPDGPLHRVPFAALLPGRDIRRLPSATILARLRATDRTAPAPDGILAVAGSENAAHVRLEGAAAEVRRLGRRFRNVAIPRIAAGADPIFGDLDPRNHAILHLACHGEVDDQRPWNSALHLGTADRPALLRAGDVAGLFLPARLAVLSSCESAGGGILAGEGVLGLAAGFLSAGVPAVVAALWPVDDVTTARLVDRFYAELAAGATTAEALVRARADLRARSATAHPFYWAGFVLLGDGDGRFALEARGPAAGRLVAAGLAGLAGAAVVVGARRGRRCARTRRRGSAGEPPAPVDQG